MRGSQNACNLCSSGRLNQTVDGRSCTLATAVAVLPPLGAAALPGREGVRDAPREGAPLGVLGGGEGLTCMDKVTLGVMPWALWDPPPAQNTGQTCNKKEDFLLTAIVVKLNSPGS